MPDLQVHLQWLALLGGSPVQPAGSTRSGQGFSSLFASLLTGGAPAGASSEAASATAPGEGAATQLVPEPFVRATLFEGRERSQRRPATPVLTFLGLPILDGPHGRGAQAERALDDSSLVPSLDAGLLSPGTERLESIASSLGLASLIGAVRDGVPSNPSRKQDEAPAAIGDRSTRAFSPHLTRSLFASRSPVALQAMPQSGLAEALPADGIPMAQPGTAVEGPKSIPFALGGHATQPSPSQAHPSAQRLMTIEAVQVGPGAQRATADQASPRPSIEPGMPAAPAIELAARAEAVLRLAPSTTLGEARGIEAAPTGNSSSGFPPSASIRFAAAGDPAASSPSEAPPSTGGAPGSAAGAADAALEKHARHSNDPSFPGTDPLEGRTEKPGTVETATRPRDVESTASRRNAVVFSRAAAASAVPDPNHAAPIAIRGSVFGTVAVPTRASETPVPVRRLAPSVPSLASRTQREPPALNAPASRTAEPSRRDDVEAPAARTLEASSSKNAVDDRAAEVVRGSAATRPASDRSDAATSHLARDVITLAPREGALTPPLRRDSFPLPPEAFERLLAQARSMTRPGTVELRFALHPEELGTVRVILSAEGDHLRVHLAARSASAVEALHGGLSRLGSQLQAAGFSQAEITLDVDHASVTQGSGHAGSHAQDSHAGASQAHHGSPRSQNQGTLQSPEGDHTDTIHHAAHRETRLDTLA